MQSPAPDIIDRAIMLGFLPENANRKMARQNLSSAFSKSIIRGKGKWVKCGRGLFGLAGRDKPEGGKD